MSTGALVLRLDVHALQQEVPFGTCLLLTQSKERRTAGCLTDSLLRSAQSVQLIRPSRSSLLLNLATIVRLSARMAALRDNVVQSRPFLSVAFPVLSIGSRQQTADTVVAGRSHHSSCNYLVLGCREHWRAGTAAGCARAATGGTFRHVLPAADARGDGRLLPD